jgi:hypothetical protein
VATADLLENSAHSGSSARPVVLFVLGMARSGTAALTRVLSLSGATLPAGMRGAGRGNPRGFWEPRAVTYLNEVILRRHGSSMYDPTLRLPASPRSGRFSPRCRPRRSWSSRIRR